MVARRIAVALVFTLGAAVVALISGPAAEATGYVECPPNVTVATWDGSANDTPGSVGDNQSWDDAWNWDVDCIPGMDDPATTPVPTPPDALIGAGNAVTLTGDEGAMTIDSLHNDGSLTITTTGVLDVSGASTSAVTVLQGWLRGSGQFAITNSMSWQSLPAGASAMSTRACISDPPCTAGPPAVPGVTVVRAGAVLNVNGSGVNFSDRRIIKNYGTLILSNGGYIAADYGTTFRNIDSTPMNPGEPAFDVQNDLGYYQGYLSDVLVGESRSIFRNSGLVRKTAGTGTSVIDARYYKTDPASSSTGRVEVQSGQLSILSPNFTGAVEAEVDQGSGFANGSPGDCANDGDPSDCTLQVDASDPEAVALDLTDPTVGSAPVTLQELSGAPNLGGFGVPVKVESPGAVATNADPMELRLFIDSSLLGSATPTQVAKRAKVQRQGIPSDPYSSLPRCAAVGGSTPTQACVDRVASVSETSAAGGDVVLVVQTQQNSRYRVGRIPVAN